jgi:thymidylate kinase
MVSHETILNYALRLMRHNKTFKSQLRPAKYLIIDYSCDLVLKRLRARRSKENKTSVGTKDGNGMEQSDKDSKEK